MPDNVEQKLSEVIHSGYIAEGDYVRYFEGELRAFLNSNCVITTNSCTSALHLALKLFGADEFNNYVLTTSMTCVATNVSITNIGATPVWVDVDPKHGMITAETLHRAYNECKFKGIDFKIAALIYVCWGGDLGPLKEVARVCKELKIPLIVDAAQAFGVVPPNVADIVCYSFQAIKHVTSGDGGAMQFKDPELMRRAFHLKWFGIDRDGFRTPTGEINWKADIEEIGFKFHMNNIAGCIGTAQLQDESFKGRLEKYQRNAEKLTEHLDGFNDIERSWRGLTSAWVATFNCDRPIELLEYLRNRGIHSSQMHVNNDIYTGFDGLKLFPLEGVQQFMKTHICLPCGWWMSGKDVNTVIKTVKEFYG